MFLLLISCPSYFVVSNVLPNLTNVLFSSVIQFIFSLSLFLFYRHYAFYYSCSLFRSELTVCCLGMLMWFLGFSMFFFCITGIVTRNLSSFSYYNLHDKYYCSVTEKRIKYDFFVLSLRFGGSNLLI